MPSTRDPRQALKEAKQIAADHGLFVVEKQDKDRPFYLLYREMHTHNVLIGRRATPQSLRTLVCKVANFH